VEQEPKKGQGEGALPRADLRMVSRAFRQDWPIPHDVQVKILKRLVAMVDPEHEDGASAPDRTVLGASKVIATFSGLSLQQQALDLQREKQDQDKALIDWTELVPAAKERALKRKAEREKEGNK